MAPFFSSPTITTSSTKSPPASGTSKAAKSKTSRAPTKNISPTPRKKRRNHIFVGAQHRCAPATTQLLWSAAYREPRTLPLAPHGKTEILAGAQHAPPRLRAPAEIDPRDVRCGCGSHL